MSDEQSLGDELHELAMQKKWREIVEKFENTRAAHTIKLTKSGDTAFHLAISSYDSVISPYTIHERFTVQMIRLIKDGGSLPEVLSMRDANGDTPLHLAAAVGWEEICEIIASEDRELIRIRNEKGETPLFVAAHHGNLEAFKILHEKYVGEDRNPDASLCRRKDGNTVLHSAISVENLRLAYLIIRHYKKLVDYVNVDGETPLHVLARMPAIFISSSTLGFYESIIYQSVLVDDLKQSTHNSTPKKRRSPSTDKENQPYVEYGVPISENFLDSCSRSKKQSGLPAEENDVENQTKSAREKRHCNGSFSPNWTTCISIFKVATTKVVQAVSGIGFLKIEKIQKKKERHCHAMEILNEMVESPPSYKYESNGQRPDQEFKPQRFVDIPDSPPPVEEDEIHHNQEAKDHSLVNPTLLNAGEKKSNGVVTDSPVLIAAKMGIAEMVQKIMCAAPIAIRDQDSEGKNVVMLAAENRRPTVFGYLMQTRPPRYVFHHVDNEGNNILHLAAKLGSKQPWQLPGAALQMQWELKWYKHVKDLVPPKFDNHRNLSGETPRQIFTRTHENLLKSGNEWMIKTSESYSLVAALIATVAFATAATVPGGLDQSNGYPILRNHEAFDIFSMAALIALGLSITALVFFLSIVTSRFEERDFKRDLTRKLLMGLNCVFFSIAAMLLSFYAGHTFILRGKLRLAAVPIYAATALPMILFTAAQLPYYLDLLWFSCRRMRRRSYKVFYHCIYRFCN